MLDLISILIKGGIVMVPLLLCSVIALAVTIERLIFWRRLRSQEIAQRMLRRAEESAGHPELDRAAAEAAKKWRFEPARRGTEPVVVWVLLPVRFQLQ